MKSKKNFKRAIGSVLAAVLTISCLGVSDGQAASVQGNTEDTSRASEESLYITSIGKIESAKITGKNIVDLTTDKEKIRVTFLKDNIFRLNMEMKDHEFLDKPVPRNPKHTAEILDKKISDYPGGEVSLDQSDKNDYIISTAKIELRINKESSKMQLKNKVTNKILWKEKEPLSYQGNNTVQTLYTNEQEYFYGGGMTNGYFSHKGTSVKIEKNPNKWTDGYPASPNPFYMSSNGYGVLRYTWMEGVYDFGESDSETVKTSHAENRFDAFYYVEQPEQSESVFVKLLQDFTEMTGKISLLPEYALYLGHLNCYSRDQWEQDPNGRYDFGGIKWKETKKNSDTAIVETLMGENKPSAQAMLQNYIDADMPIGYLLPNDGYGCGYGRGNTLDGNVSNLKKYASYAMTAHKVETGLWTQSDLTPIPSEEIYLQRDLAKEVQAGVHVLKTDVAWVGPGYSMALNGIKQAAEIIEANSDYRRFIISLDGWAGTQRYAGLWSGDQTGGNWEYIRFHIPTYIGSGLSGNPNVGSDQNGIWGEGSVISTRDYQWKSFTPIQLDMDGWANEVKHPSYYTEYAGINRMYLKLKAQMLPYNYSNAWEASETSMPMLRAMLLEYPDDPYTYGTATQYQYMWGPSLLVAPVYREDENVAGIRNHIYLPDENQVWIDYFTGKQYKGGQILNNFEAPLWKQPVFVKSGAIIPMTEENNQPSAIAPDAVRTFEVWPSGKTEFTMYEDDGYSQEYKKSDAFATTRITSDAPVHGKSDGTATIKVEKPIGNYAATGNSKEHKTEFIINVQKKPTGVALEAGGSIIPREVRTLEEYHAADDAVYFYHENPDLNKYEKAGSQFDTKIITSPKLYVKTAKTDITANDVILTVKGFNNTMAAADDGTMAKPGIPVNAAIDETQTTDHQIAFRWDAAEDARTYELRIGGKSKPVIKNVQNTSYIFEELAPDTEYKLEVRSANRHGVSDWVLVTGKTKLDRFRNVPEGMEAKWDGEVYAGQAAAYAVDGDETTVFHSNPTQAYPQTLTIDMKKVYDLEKVEYMPRADKGNGTFKKLNLYTSTDGKNYTLTKENVQFTYTSDEAGYLTSKTIELDQGTSARFLKFEVTNGVGGFLSATEIRPYKVDGTDGHVLGDYSENGVLDDGDLVFMENYIGTMEGDHVWEYTSKADQNKNGVIDGYDLAFLLSMFDGGNAPTGGELRGNLVFKPSKTSLEEGETMSVSVVGMDMNDIYGYSIQTKLPEGLKLVANSIAQTQITQHMHDYSKISDSNGYLMIAMSNQGQGVPVNGTGDVATFQVEALKDLDAITIVPRMANVVSSDIVEKDAKKN